MLGIYGYYDIEREEFVYIGKDSHIDRKTRHYAHRSPSHFNKQHFNKVLQNNPTRYIYQVLVNDVECEERLNALEIMYISNLKPLFNFTEGGEGISGFKHSKETIQKISDAQKGERNSMYGVRLTGERNGNYGKTYSLKEKVNISKYQNTSGYFRVTKETNKSCKTGFIWRYVFSENGHRKSFTSVKLDDLKNKVESYGLPWINIEKEEKRKYDITKLEGNSSSYKTQ